MAVCLPKQTLMMMRIGNKCASGIGVWCVANGVVRGKLHVERATCDVWGVEIDKRCV